MGTESLPGERLVAVVEFSSRLSRNRLLLSLQGTSSVSVSDACPVLSVWVDTRLYSSRVHCHLCGGFGKIAWTLPATIGRLTLTSSLLFSFPPPQALEPGQKLIELPARCQLTYSPETADPKLLALINQVPAELWGAKLALALLQHRVAGTDSPFAAYVAMLPVGFSGIPMFFGRDAIEAIDYPPVSAQVKKRCRWLYDFSQPLAQLPGSAADPFGGAAVDMNALGWALAAVSSRAFRTKGPTQPASMLPLIDMCNHSFTPNCEVLPTSDGALALFAKRGLEAGEPLVISYGALSNDFLFMDYGFVVPDNPHDTVQLRFDVGMLQVGGRMDGCKRSGPLIYHHGRVGRRWVMHERIRHLESRGGGDDTKCWHQSVSFAVYNNGTAVMINIIGAV